MKDKIIEIIKLGLRHSIAQAFLIFSGFLVVISILWAKDAIYVYISFFTLFYALIAHYLTTLRKNETLGEYTNSDGRQVIFFTLSYISFFVWWATGVFSILLNLGETKWCYSISMTLLCLSFYALIVGILLISIWLFLFFKKVIWVNFVHQKEAPKENIYRVNRSCKNCDNVNIEVDIIKGVSFENYPCPKCGVIALEK